MTTETYRDAWGIPHLRATSARELARAQGRVTAIDRAWQLEVERHRAQGTSASFLGASALPWDIFARRARLDDTARRCFAALERRDPETADWVRAYVDGVNAGLAEGAARTPEFARVGLAPGRWEPWTPLGVWLGTHILFAGFPAKLWREEAIRHLGPDAVGLFATDGPGTAGSNGWLLAGTRTTTGLPLLAGDPHRFLEDPGVYQQIRLSCPEFDVVGLAVPGVPGIAHFAHTGPVAWSITNAMADYQDLYHERLRRTGAGVEALSPEGVWQRAVRCVEVVEVAEEGAVEIEVIETERGPVIAGGPEGLGGLEGVVKAEDASAEEGVPSGPEAFADSADPVESAAPAKSLDSADPAEPSAPAASAESAEFSASRSSTSGQRRADASGSSGGAVSLGSLDAPVPSPIPLPTAADGGSAPQGPPAPDDESCTGGAGGNQFPAEGEAEAEAPATALALRYPPRVTEDLGFSALLPLLRARTVADVDRALDAWTEPVNVVQAADTTGAVLHRLAGRVPVRPRTNSLRVVSAWEKGHEWQGWHTPPYAPLDNGIAVMANQRGPATPLGIEFAPPHRANRIRTLLEQRPTWSATDLPAIHTDTHLASAAPLLTRLAQLKTLTPEATRLRDTLLSWNRHMDADSVEAAVYAALRTAVVRRLAAHPAFAPLTEPPAYPEVLLPWMSLTARIGFALEHLLNAEGLYGIDRQETVREALEEIAEAPPTTPWSATHRVAPWRALPEPPYTEPGLAGDHDCVNCTTAVPGITDLAARGPAARYVWDLNDRDNSRWIVPFGADGVPGNPHHRDQLPLWLKGDLAEVVTDWTQLTLEHTDIAEEAHA
ncbi:penicillin acylase family protein [Streptomyces bauhiniae]|uniref:Penicillin acylase family protein n=1 Tax=Streptomyces bauhiniae TaxID=2340725 RepID=A0A4Z1CYR3_9ACTN|nr:penicillin acylase family protein [Streptomyces bauhiniae]TGN74515.1 penicillin acylase family protein [Streptomyces bauhiniae]